MRLVAFCFSAALMASSAQAQAVGSAGPNSTGKAAANASAAASETRSAAAVTSSGATIQINSPAQSDNCSLPVSAGYGSDPLGVTFVWSHADASCVHIRLFDALMNAGDPESAMQVLCDLPIVKAAKARSGKPCDAPAP